MGNSESQQAGQGGDNRSAAASSEMRTCYYEVLEVERSDSTTADDIKKVRKPFYPDYHFDKLSSRLLQNYRLTDD
jgi:hypothetical protein